MEIDKDAILRKHARKVEKFDERLATLLTDMAETMRAGDGVGLAAPQVGVLKRAVVIDIGFMEQSEEPKVLELVNPEIISTEGECTVIEGCLSVPGRSGKVVRPEKVSVRAQDRNGNFFEVTGDKLLAVCLCHEIDHLDGILYVDKMIEDVTEEMKQKQEARG